MKPDAFSRDLEALILLCNSQALEYIAEGQYAEALALLRKAESYFEHPLVLSVESPTKHHLHGVTLTNLGCYYKEVGKLKVALHYLALGLEQLQTAGLSVKETARAQITLSAVHSSLHQHETALTHAQAALELLLYSQVGEYLAVELLTAYHNAATELEHLSRLPESVETYRKGLAFAEKELRGHPIEAVLRKGYEAVRRRLEVWTEKSKSRREKRETHKVPPHLAVWRASPQRAATTRLGLKLPEIARQRAVSTSRQTRPLEHVESA